MKRLFTLFYILLLIACSKDDTAKEYDGGRWERCDDQYFPGTKGRHYPIFYASNDTLVYGVGDHPTIDTAVIFRDLWLYTSEGWNITFDVPGPKRMEPILFMQNHKIFYGLGRNLNPSKDGFFKDMWVYDLIDKSWNLLPFEFPGKGRTGGILFSLENQFFLGGGSGGWGDVLNDIYSFDLENGWELYSPEFIEPLTYGTVFKLNNVIYTCFGKNRTGYNDVVRKFNVESKKWEAVRQLKDSSLLRTYGKVFVLNQGGEEYAYIVGGKPIPGIEADNFCVGLRFNPRTNIMEKINMPNVKNIEAAFAIKGVGYIFDGEYRWKFLP